MAAIHASVNSHSSCSSRKDLIERSKSPAKCEPTTGGNPEPFACSVIDAFFNTRFSRARKNRDEVEYIANYAKERYPLAR